MFGPIGGLVPGMFPVGAGQLLLADRRARLTWKRWRKIRHGGVVVQAGSKPFINSSWWADKPARLVQAMPHGAEEIELTAKHWTLEYVYLRPAYDIHGFDRITQPQEVAEAARGYVGTPYNFLTYGALAARKLRLVLTDRLLRRWISRRRDMMCSQLMDQCLADASFHVFDDGRLPQDVVPAELYRALLEMPGTRVLVPGCEWMDTVDFSSSRG